MATAQTSSHKKVVVCCVGDSITEGYGCSDKSRTYPAVLQAILSEEAPGDVKYEVCNFGVCGSCAAFNSFRSYCRRREFRNALEEEGDMYFVMLGSNDFCMGIDNATFVKDLSNLLLIFVDLDSQPLVKVIIPPPLYYGRDEPLNSQIPLLVRGIAAKLGLGDAVDVFEALGGAELKKPHLFPDGCHPNDEGYAMIAREVANVILKLHLSSNDDSSAM